MNMNHVLLKCSSSIFSLIKELKGIDEAFYFRPSKTEFKFRNAPEGIHKLNSIVPFLMKEAGLDKKTAHCLRVTTATNLFQGKHEKKLIRERTGHISPLCLHTRSHTKSKEWPFQEVSDNAF